MCYATVDFYSSRDCTKEQYILFKTYGSLNSFVFLLINPSIELDLEISELTTKFYSLSNKIPITSLSFIFITWSSLWFPSSKDVLICIKSKDIILHFSRLSCRSNHLFISFCKWIQSLADFIDRLINLQIIGIHLRSSILKQFKNFIYKYYKYQGPTDLYLAEHLMLPKIYCS